MENQRAWRKTLRARREPKKKQTRNRATLAGGERCHHPTIHALINCNSHYSESAVLIISYHQNTIKIIKMMITTPTTTPITIHFQALLLDSTGPAVGDVVGDVVGVATAGLTRTSTSEMFAPIAASSADL